MTSSFYPLQMNCNILSAHQPQFMVFNTFSSLSSDKPSMMLRQSLLPGILILLLAHTVISSVTGIPVIASATACFTSNSTSTTHTPWPSYLPGWGTLTVDRNLLANEYDTGLLIQPGAWDALPCVYTIHRQGNGTCGNSHDFPHTHAVNGTLCLPEGDEYESIAKNVTGSALAELEAEKAHCGCHCKCQLGCLGKFFCLFLWWLFLIEFSNSYLDSLAPLWYAQPHSPIRSSQHSSCG